MNKNIILQVLLFFSGLYAISTLFGPACWAGAIAEQRAASRSVALRPAVQSSPGYALRFYGHGVDDIDRVKIPIDPHVPADVSGDFTLEFWMKADLSDNNSTPGWSCSQFYWIFGNIIFDRDIFGGGDYGDYGLSLYEGRVRFGVGNANQDETICGTTIVADGQWHHIAVTRRSSDGQMRIYVDGQQDAQGSGPTGRVDYRDGRDTAFPDSDPYLVIGAEKHDAGADYPSYNGLLDEVRLSSVIRYEADFSPSNTTFNPDTDTVALYHFDEGPAGACSGLIWDSSGVAGGPSNGTCQYGGSGLAGPVYVTDTLFDVGLPTPTPTPTPIPTDTPTPTATATDTLTATASDTPTLTPTPTHTPSPSHTPSAEPTAVPSLTPSPSVTATHTSTPMTGTLSTPTGTGTPSSMLPPTSTPTDTATPGSGSINVPVPKIYLPLVSRSR